MSDLMLHGVLNMPMPDDPKNIGLIEWVQFRDRARQASRRINELETQLARAHAALTPFAEAADECDDYGYDDDNQAPVSIGDCRIARDVLEGKQ